MPASRLSSTCSMALPSTAANSRSSTRVSAASAWLAAGNHSRSASSAADSRCGPRCQTDGAAPRHQGRGSKSCSASRPRSCQPAATVRASSVAWARAAPAVTSACSRRRWRWLTSPLSCSCTGPPVPSSKRPLSWATIASCGTAAAGAAAGLPPDALAATRPGALAVALAAAAGLLACGSGRPVARSATGPLSTRSAARRCRRAGRSASSRRSSDRASPRHWPWPLMRPAAPASPAAVPNCRSNRSSVSRSVWLGLPLATSVSVCSGTRPWSQAPGKWLLSWAVTLAGWSSPRVTMSARPARRVCGQCGDSAARSSASVSKARSARGQASNGSTVARACSVGAAAPAGTWPASCHVVSSRASGPLLVSVARQAGLRAEAARCSASVARSGSGASVPICRSACQGSGAGASALPRSNTPDAWSSRCSRPPSAPSANAACSWRSGACWSRRSSPTVSASICRSNGRRRSLGACSGLPVGAPLSNCRWSICSVRRRTAACTPGRGRKRSTRPSTRRPLARSRPKLAGSCRSSDAIRSVPCCSVPCTP